MNNADEFNQGATAASDAQVVDPETRPTSFAGASPAVPRDPRLLAAERAEYDALTAEREAEEAQRAAESALARAAAAKANAERSREELSVAREEAKAKARAAALQVRLEEDEADQALTEERLRSRAEREEQLGAVAPVEDVEPEVVTIVERQNDKLAGALGLFIPRLILAALVGIVGWQIIVYPDRLFEHLAYMGLDTTHGAIPFAVGGVLIVMALMLVVGLGTRIVSIILLILFGVFLAFFRFGPFSPFIEGRFGFYGDREILMASLAWIHTFLGAGGWSIDRVMRRRKEQATEN